MSTFTIKPVTPSFDVPASGHTFAPCADAWQMDAATITPAFAGAADRTYVLTEGGVAFEAKRRNAEGSPAWRPSDC